MREPRRGAALTEYVLGLLAIAIMVIGIVVQYGHDLDAEWRNTDDSSGPLEEVVSDLEEGCNFYFNDMTGRWHDSETGLFVSFDDAADSGCS